MNDALALDSEDHGRDGRSAVINFEMVKLYNDLERCISNLVRGRDWKDSKQREEKGYRSLKQWAKVVEPQSSPQIRGTKWESK